MFTCQQQVWKPSASCCFKSQSCDVEQYPLENRIVLVLKDKNIYLNFHPGGIERFMRVSRCAFWPNGGRCNCITARHSKKMEARVETDDENNMKEEATIESMN